MPWKAVKDYRCGEPVKSKHQPKPEVEKVLVEHLGPHARLFKGGVYANLPDPVVKALEKDKGIEPA